MKNDKKKTSDDITTSSDDDSDHILVETLPKLEVNPTSKIASRGNLKFELKRQQTQGKSKIDGSTIKHSHSMLKSTMRQSKDNQHTRKTSEGFQRSKLILRTSTKPALRGTIRGRSAIKNGKKSNLDILEAQVVANENRQQFKTLSIDAILKRSLFGESTLRGKTPGALRLSSQFYGPTNLLELRDKRTKELMSFTFLTRGHLVDPVEPEAYRKIQT